MAIDYRAAFYELCRYFNLLTDDGKIDPRGFVRGYLGMPAVQQIIQEQ